MPDRICLFEDAEASRLLPLAWLRPVYDLRCGMTTLREKIVRQYPGAVLSLLCRDYVAQVVRRQNPGVAVNHPPDGSCLFVNGRLLAGEGVAAWLPVAGPEALYYEGDTLVAARLGPSAAAAFQGGLAQGRTVLPALARTPVEATLIAYAWDLVRHNGEQIGADFAAVTEKGMLPSRGRVYEGAHLLNPSAIHIAEGATVKPGVVLDAEGGPIYIGAGAKIFPNAVIEGPAFVGAGSLVKIGAKIYEHTSIGEMCKVGGEVEASIIHSFSNKQHDGFLGHAYLGMWVNLGADTNNSDLKNNYGNVKVYVNGAMVDSGSMFVGLTMGDHAKSGINTMFNTGTVVGVSSNVFGSDFPKKYVPSFTWGGADGMTVYDVDRSIEVARRVMARRKVTMTEEDAQLLREVFRRTEEERRMHQVE